ncbi:tetratricopeptide repeat protein [Halobacteriovorax sp. HLS]|uniref:tetratricopeptide repeat protein n=1 Tax=Halobacteriovorax sp. HLS TaxID=2234000 RepID=UPI000FDBB0F7|nr:tetratricopeptide repeat protein [Halobacteriovorax sp. HLS]
MLNKFNLNYLFNSSLREVPDDVQGMKNYISRQVNGLEKILEPIARVKVLGEIGSYSRMLENLNQAEEFLNEAMALIDKHDLGIKYWVQNGIRLAHIYQWQGRYDIAEEMFYDLEEMCELKREVSDYLHFVIQHIGKFNFQICSFEVALECFEEALAIREKLGDQSLIDSSKYAIAMTKVAIEEEEDNLIDFPDKRNFESSDIKSASDFTSMVKQHFEGGEFSSIDEMNAELGAITANQNSMGLGPFLGLSPNDMQGVLYSPFSLENHIFKFESKDINEIKGVPFIAQAIYFMSKIKADGFIKATQKGNLSKAFVLEIYHEYFSKEKYARLPNKEDDLPQLTRLKHILDMSGLIKKRSGKFSLTKKGEKITEKENYLELFKILVGTLFNDWNWGYSDGYSDLTLIQQSAIFNIHLLNKKAHDWTLDKELGKYYLEAFPMLVNEVEASYFGPEEEIVNSFCTRFLSRICLPLGFLEAKEEGKGFDRKEFYRVTPLFKKILKFNL